MRVSMSSENDARYIKEISGKRMSIYLRFNWISECRNLSAQRSRTIDITCSVSRAILVMRFKNALIHDGKHAAFIIMQLVAVTKMSR